MLNKDTFVMVAMRAYDNPHCKTLIEFEEDLAKFSNLVRLCSKDFGEIETVIIMNAVMTLLNIFEQEACIKMMFFKVKKVDWNKLKTVLTYLGRMPEAIPELGIIDKELETCQPMMQVLSRI